MLQKRCTTLKYMRRNRNRLGKPVLVVCGFLLSLVVPGLPGAQSNSPEAATTARPASPAAPAKADTRPMDDFAGLTFTDDQRAKIAQIHHNAKLRKEAVVKNERLSQGQKDVTLEGLQRMERSEIFKVLTPEQQAEVRKRIMARRAAEEQLPKQAAPAPH